MDNDTPQGPWYPRIVYVPRGQTPPVATDAEADRLDELTPAWLFEPSFLRWTATATTGHRSCKRARVAAASEAVLQEVPASDALQSECAVCLQDFVAGETLRAMPCSHAFHCHCISEWLIRKASCPLCRRHLITAHTPTPEEDDDVEEYGVDGVEWVDTSGEVEWVDGGVVESSWAIII